MKTLLAVAAAPLVLLLTVTTALPQQGTAGGGAACAVNLDGQEVEELTPEQAGNARIVVGVALQLGLPLRAAVIAVATTQQESRLRNIAYGDRDSLGLFQQRPSQGWGTPAQILDPVYSSRKFYQGLVEVAGWESMPLTVAAQAVQRSGYPTAYAKWESLAVATVDALVGSGQGALTCGIDDDPEAGSSEVAAGGTWPPEQTGPDGLTARTRAAMDAVMRTFGVTTVGGFCPGGCATGHIKGSDHYTGHAIDVMLLPINENNRRRGDAIATWLVANADRLAIKYLIWNEKIWSRSRSAEGWRPYRHPSGSSNATLAHRDHVHLSVM